MRLSLRRTGGFAGMAFNADVDTATLSASERERVEQLAAKLATSPPGPRNPQARDVYTYELHAGGKTYTADDTNLPDDWRPLLDWLSEHGGG
jgi:hypothetical protein